MGARQQLSSKFMIKTLIADDHAVVRRGLKQILQETPDIIASGEASDSCEVLDLVRKHSWTSFCWISRCLGAAGSTS